MVLLLFRLVMPTARILNIYPAGLLIPPDESVCLKIIKSRWMRSQGREFCFRGSFAEVTRRFASIYLYACDALILP